MRGRLIHLTCGALTVIAAVVALAPAAALADSMDAMLFKLDSAYEKTVPLPIAGLGSWHHAVTTDSPRAQLFFDRGLRLLYAFNHPEAIRAFKEAIRLDPTCAMAYWGVALALGPNINKERYQPSDLEAEEYVRKALAVGSFVSSAERAYIDALAERYSRQPIDGHELDTNYARAMRQLAQRYPEDADAATLFAESMMDLTPWNFWDAQGRPKSDTIEIVSTLQAVLAHHPDHPGANHYLIHVLEASADPGRAMDAAHRLETLMPAAGHMLHMPSHIYFRLGRYADSARVNRAAIAADESYIARFHPQGSYPEMYYPHNVDFLWASQMMEGASAESLASARKLLKVAPPSDPGAEFYAPVVFFTLVRFGQWRRMTHEAAPPRRLKASTGLWHYARGLALAHLDNLDAAQRELQALQVIRDTLPKENPPGPSPGRAHLTIAGDVLSATIDRRRGRDAEAVSKLRQAVALQDELSYSEPPSWYYPVRESLGSILLNQGEPSQALTVFEEDLRRNPNNGRSLWGMLQCLRALGDKARAAQVKARFDAAWVHADVKPDWPEF